MPIFNVYQKKNAHLQQRFALSSVSENGKNENDRKTCLEAHF